MKSYKFVFKNGDHEFLNSDGREYIEYQPRAEFNAFISDGPPSPLPPTILFRKVFFTDGNVEYHEDFPGRFADWNNEYIDPNKIPVIPDGLPDGVHSDDIPPEILNMRFSKDFSLSSGGPPSRTMVSDAMGCPHPEWLGIWDRSGVSVFGVIKITWENGVFMSETNEHKSEVVECWDGPYEGWKLIEPAPLEARAHTNPKESVNVGWDPYGEG